MRIVIYAKSTVPLHDGTVLLSALFFSDAHNMPDSKSAKFDIDPPETVDFLREIWYI